MTKILTIMVREYKAMVGTKAFLLSILMVPVLMFGSIAAMAFLPRLGELKERRIVVYEGSNNLGLFGKLQKEAELRNRRVRDAEATPGQKPSAMNRQSSGELFLLEKGSDSLDDARKVQMSDEIRKGELYAFVELPPDLVDERGRPPARFFAQDASISEARGWLTQILSSIVRNERLSKSFDSSEIEAIARAEAPVAITAMGLFDKTAAGEVKAAEEKSEIVDLLLPLAFMMLMFMVIFMAAQPLLETVLEEKSQRIAEVLLGSVSPTQLMVGKLLGTVSGSLTIFLFYMVGSYFVASQRGWTDLIPLQLLPWFLVFQVLSVLFYAAIFMAIGASVSQLKEAQSLLLPVWMVMMLPMFVWLLIIRDPLGPLARGMSFFPPATGTTMILRLATNQTIPVWELITALVLLLLSTAVIIVVAGRIFRVGILWQGKMPKLGELVRWALMG